MKEYKAIFVGFLVTLVLLMLTLFIHASSGTRQQEGAFHLFANFSKSDGIMNGAEVRIAGIPVGKVVSQRLVDGYRVQIEMAFDKPIDLPADTSVLIETDGLLGAKHLELLPGAEEDMLTSGETLGYTQDALILGELLDKVNAFMRDKKEREAAERATLAAAAAPTPDDASQE